MSDALTVASPLRFVLRVHVVPWTRISSEVLDQRQGPVPDGFADGTTAADGSDHFLLGQRFGKQELQQPHRLALGTHLRRPGPCVPNHQAPVRSARDEPRTVRAECQLGSPITPNWFLGSPITPNWFPEG